MMSDADSILTLQDADFKLLQLRKRLEELPYRKQIEDAHGRIGELEAKQRKVAEIKKQAQKALSLLADEQAILQRKLDAAKDKLQKGGSYKETAALSAEIESLARHISKLEDEELVQMEKLDKTGDVERQVEGALQSLKAQEQQLVANYKQQGGVINATIVEQTVLREQLLASLPEELARRYSKAQVSKGGIAAAKLEGSHCSACHVDFSDGQIQRFRAEKGGISECPHCHRILVLPR
jgi:predicted  nucleic acid-binding Zn-ribbon protein